jgi:TonB family protein
MKRLTTHAVTLMLILAACRDETKPFLPEQTDTREPIATYYVSTPELPIYEKPNEASPVIMRYQNGESVRVLAEQGEWVEIRTGDRSGWVKRSGLGSSEAATQAADTTVARFVKAPNSVISMTATGDIYIEADVNTDGDVVNTRIISNSTGNDALAAQNAAALRTAKFYPIMKNGERQPFKYYHRVTY